MLTIDRAPCGQVVDIASSTYTVKGLGSARSQRIKPGVYFIIRHQVYGGNAFAVTSSRGVAWDAVTVYSIPGMGFYAGDSTDLTLQSTAIRRRPGRPMSITAGIPPFLLSILALQVHRSR